MTVRENMRQLVDTLPEDRLAGALDYLAELTTRMSSAPKPRLPSKNPWRYPQWARSRFEPGGDLT